MINSELEALARQAIADKIFPGCVVGLIDAGGQNVLAFGTPTYEDDRPITPGSVYDVASLTKTVVTATLLHQLIDEGRCRLSDPVATHIPEFAANGKDGVLVEHLLSYTLQLATVYRDDWKGDTSLWVFSELLQLFYDAPLKAPPGETYLYTDTTAILLGELIRRLAGRDLQGLAEERIFRPLGMHDSTLDPAAFARDPGVRARIVPTGFRPDGRLIWVIPNDEKAEIAYAAGVQSGLAGLFTTVPDLLRWVATIFNGGRVDGTALLSPRAVELMTRDYYPDRPFRSTLGWGDGPTHQVVEGAADATLLVKGGFTGCFMIGDMAARKAIVFVSNRVHPTRPTDLRPWHEFRRSVVRAYFGPARR